MPAEILVCQALKKTGTALYRGANPSPNGSARQNNNSAFPASSQTSAEGASPPASASEASPNPFDYTNNSIPANGGNINTFFAANKVEITS